MPQDDPLSGLRAIRLPPETTSFWADVGFAAAAGLGLALIAALLVRALFRPRRSLRASALDALAEAESLPAEERRAAQAALLRRVVRTVEGEEAARATGADWSRALDRVFSTDLFGARAGRVFADGLYTRPTASSDDRDLDRELDGLIRKLRR
jgi:hypothetical protein